MTKAIKIWSVTIRKCYSKTAVDRVKSIFNEFAAQWCFQEERGSKEDGEHYQCRIILPEGQTKATMLDIFSKRFSDMRDVSMDPESNKSIEQGGLSFYVMKDDTKVAGPWYDATYKVPKKVTYEAKDLKCMDTPLPFQQKIIDLASQEPDDRTINWIHNATGCAGKSKLMKWMYCVSNLDMARIPMGSAIQIKTCVIEKGPHQIYMVDLPRVRGGDERQQELFSAIEEIKNGWVESPMYGKNAELIMEPPHIFVFSNEMPNLSFASQDRWVIWNLEDGNMERFFPGTTL